LKKRKMCFLMSPMELASIKGIPAQYSVTVLTEISVCAACVVSLLGGIDATEKYSETRLLATPGSIHSRPTYRPTYGQLVENS
jgi:hypothetical protein